MGLPGVHLTLAELSASASSASASAVGFRAALGAFLRAAREMRESGTFTLRSRSGEFDQ